METGHPLWRHCLRASVALTLLSCSLSANAMQWRELNPGDLGNTKLAANTPLKIASQPSASKIEFRHQQKATNGTEHWRYQQTWYGLPIWGQMIDVHKRGNKPAYMQGRIAVNMPARNIKTLGALNGTQAIDAAKQQFTHKNPSQSWQYSDEHAEHVWYVEGTTAIEAFATYFRAETHAGEPVRWNAIVDAQSGTVLRQWNGLTHEDATGPGGNVKTGRYRYGTDLPFLDVTRNGNTCVMTNSSVTTVNNNGGYEGPTHTFDCPENNFHEVNGAFSPINDAHFFGSATFKMYQSLIGVAPLTFPLVMHVHYGQGYENAFWDGSTMNFGDGATMFYPLVDSNVVAHEVSHGFTEQHSGLIYDHQSGGINEAFSDMAGEALEQYVYHQVDWQVGASIVKQENTALRYFDQPSRDGSSIDNANQYYDGIDVHHSSGVYNRMFYLLATSPGWTIDKAFQVVAYANRYYWQPNTTFVSGACSTIMGADDLGYDWKAVNTAFLAVGVTCNDLPMDSDGDGMPDGWEQSNGLNPLDPADAPIDNDNDQLTNLDEYHHHTNPNNADTDADGLADNNELQAGTDPTNADSDQDQMPDGWETQYGLNPLLNDAQGDLDGDGIINLDEYIFGSNPADINSIPQPTSNYSENFDSGTAKGWSTSQPAWYVSEMPAGSDQKVFRSAVIFDGGATTATRYLFTNSGALDFDIGVDSESNYDFLDVYIDNILVQSISGNQRQHVHTPLIVGKHTIVLNYHKDSSVSIGADAGWIDNVTFISDQDSDGDGMPDYWETAHGLDPSNASDANLDSDSDGLSNLNEFLNGTRPEDADSDHDGATDGVEIQMGSNPLLTDTDSDGMPDGWEIEFGLAVLTQDDFDDQDNDGFTNLIEFLCHSTPNDRNSVPADISHFEQSFENNSLEGWSANRNDVPWFVSTDFASDGSHSLRSGVINAGQVSTMQFYAFTTDGKLSFDAGIESDSCCNQLNVLVDSAVVTTMSGINQQHVMLEVDAGLHSIAVYYYKNSSIVYGRDAAWIDNIRLAPKVDTDGDGLYDDWETEHGLNPNNAADAGQDRDNDGLSNLQEYRQKTSIDDPDTDHDGATDGAEVNAGSNPNNPDTDGDSMPDGWELDNHLDPRVYDAFSDPDGDGLPNLEERDVHTNPQLADTDGDGLNDGDEHHYNGTSPINPDTDGDVMTDGWEFTHNLDPLQNDFAFDNDNDGFSNGREFLLASSPDDATSVPQPTRFYRETFESGILSRWYTTSAQVPFSIGNEESNTGTLSLRSGVIQDGMTSNTNLTLMTVEGTLRFTAGVDSEVAFDLMTVTLDGEEIGKLSGKTQRDFKFDVTEGIHTLTFTYTKNVGTSTGQDLAWIDDVVFLAKDSDYDQDGIQDEWELAHGYNPEDATDATRDDDGDSLDTHAEFLHDTNPSNADSDNDGLPDNVEVNYHLNPLDASDAQGDLDGDGVSNLGEFSRGTDPSVPDRSANGSGNGHSKGGGALTLPLLLMAGLLTRRRKHHSAFR